MALGGRFIFVFQKVKAVDVTALSRLLDRR